MEAILFLIFLLLVFGIPEFWLVAWSVRLIKRKRLLSLAFGVTLALGAVLWPLAFFGGIGAIIAGGITTAR